LRGWIVPDFSTTTPSDRIVGCAALMGAMKEYFSYTAHTRCGIPRITLEGTREDWEEILRRADRIAEYGDECVLWHRMLMPVLRRFVATFDDSGLKKHETKKFWESMVQYKNPGSGTPYFSGWLTAFCAFDVKGNWLHSQVCPFIWGSDGWYSNAETGFYSLLGRLCSTAPHTRSSRPT